jgi:hypothetical protein
MDQAGIDFIGSLMDRNLLPGQCAQWGVTDAFRPEHFVYDDQSDTYTCGKGRRLGIMDRKTHWADAPYLQGT